MRIEYLKRLFNRVRLIPEDLTNCVVHHKLTASPVFCGAVPLEWLGEYVLELYGRDGN